MPITKLANTAIDAVTNSLDAVFDEIVRFAGSDLLCYRADGPKELIDRQATAGIRLSPGSRPPMAPASTWSKA